MVKSVASTTLLLVQSPVSSRPISWLFAPLTSVTLPDRASVCRVFTLQLYTPGPGAVTVKKPLASVVVLYSLLGPPLCSLSDRVIGTLCSALGWVGLPCIVTCPVSVEPATPVGVSVGVSVAVLVGVFVDVLVGVFVGVNVPVGVFVGVNVLVGVSVGVKVFVGVLVGVLVGVFVLVGVKVGVLVGVFVRVNVLV